MLFAVPSRLRKLRGEKRSRTPAARRVHAVVVCLRGAPGTGRRSVLVLWCAPARLLGPGDAGTSQGGAKASLETPLASSKYPRALASVSKTLASLDCRRAC